MGKFAQKDDEAQLTTVHPVLREIARITVDRLPFDCFVVQGHRSREVQWGLYQIGRTVEKWRKPVTNIDGKTKLSRHNFSPSFAVDIAPCSVIQDGKWVDSYLSDNQFNQIGHMAEIVALEMDVKDFEWGGRWKKNLTDKPHLQLNRSK